MEIRGVYLAFVYGLSSAIAFAFMNFVLKHFCEGVSAALAALVRGLVGTLILFPVFWKSRRIYTSRLGIKIWLRSLAGAGSVLCLFYNVKHLAVGDAIMLSNLSPVFVILLQYLFFRDALRFNEVFGTFIVVAGVTALCSPNVQGIPLQAIGIGLMGAMFAALAYLTLKHASKYFTAAEIVWAFCLMTALAGIMLGGGADLLENVDRLTIGSVGYHQLALTVVAGIIGLGGQIFMTKAFTRLSAVKAGSINVTMVVWGVFFESVWTNTLPSATAILSYVTVLLGLVAVQFRWKKRVLASAVQTDNLALRSD